MKLRPIAFGLTLFVIVCGFVTYGLNSTDKVKAAGVIKPVTGWAWSSNIGWVQMNTGQANSVAVDSNGNFTGYGWSPNVGWLQFNPAGPYPAGPNHGVQIDLQTNTLSGWGRFLANGGGWDGWVNFSNVSYDPDAKNFSGYAWGADVVGWMDMSQVVADLTATPPECDPDLYNGNCTCTNPAWASDNPDTCVPPPTNLNVQCSASPTSPTTDPTTHSATVTWSAVASNGDGSYQYTWSEGQTGSSYTREYGVGTYPVSVDAQDGSGATGHATCSVTVKNGQPATSAHFSLSNGGIIRVNCDATTDCSKPGFLSTTVDVLNDGTVPITINTPANLININSAAVFGGNQETSVSLDPGQKVSFGLTFTSRLPARGVATYKFSLTGSGVDSGLPVDAPAQPVKLIYTDSVENPR